MYRRWYGKRFSRIIIPYLVGAIPFYIWFCIYHHYGLFRFFYHLSGASFWFEREGFWYVDLLIPLYILTPVMALFIEWKKQTRLFVTLLMIGLCFIFCLVPDTFGNATLHEIISNVKFVTCRLPGYIWGYYMGEYVMKKKSIVLFIFSICVFYIAFAKIPLIDKLYRGWLLAIILLVFFGVVIHFLKYVKNMKSLTWLGERTLELYLANCILHPFLFSFSFKIGNVDLSRGNLFYYFLVVVLGFPLAELIRKASAKIRNFCQHKSYERGVE